MLDLVAETLNRLLELENLVYLLAGVGVGLTVGILPGLGGPVGMSLLLPFVYGAPPEQAIALMIGTVAVVHTADTFPSVLLGVPGSSGSQATIMDGYPLARSGQAGRALSAAFLASLAGGVVGAMALLLILPVARPMVLAFGSPELFMLSVLGLAMVGVLAGRRPGRGVLMATLGLLIGAVGAAPSTPFYRYTFDLLYLYDGLPLAVVALGLFAVPEVLDLLVAGGAIARRPVVSARAGWMLGVGDVIRERLLVVRSALLGVGVGILPGLGGSVVDWISYGVAARTVKNPEGFGEGDIRGVIAPEASNNAKEGGALIPTLLFGIPGSGTTAVLLGGLILLGIQPGPRMLDENLDITLLIVWTLAVANVFGTLACLGVSGAVARLATVPAVRLAPFLLVVMTAGAFQSSRSWGDLVAFVAIGVVAWVLRRHRFPVAPLLVGFVLSGTIERNLFLSVSRYGTEWIWRPGVLAIALIVVALTSASARVQRRGARQRESEPDGARVTGVLGGLLMVGAVATGMALTFPFRARVYPLTVGVVATVLAAVLLWRERERGGEHVSEAWKPGERGAALRYVAWIVGYLVMCGVVGMIPAAGLFVSAFLIRVAHGRWARSVVAGALVVAALYALGRWLQLQWPSTLISRL